MVWLITSTCNMTLLYLRWKGNLTLMVLYVRTIIAIIVNNDLEDEPAAVSPQSIQIWFGSSIRSHFSPLINPWQINQTCIISQWLRIMWHDTKSVKYPPANATNAQHGKVMGSYSDKWPTSQREDVLLFDVYIGSYLRWNYNWTIINIKEQYNAERNRVWC